MGARATFSIALRFPGTQTVLPDGRVVWSQNCTVNGGHGWGHSWRHSWRLGWGHSWGHSWRHSWRLSGASLVPPAGTRMLQGDPVYPEQLAEGSDGVFPDGQPFPRSAWGKRGRFVYVWWTWGEDGSVLRSRRCWAVPVPDCGVPAGRYWQVVDGATSQLTVGTDGVALGSYTMEVVVYHYRGRQRFIPIGHASTQFSITGRQRWGGWAGRGHGVPMLTSPCPHTDVPVSPC